jgi:hypothetical protein
VIIWDPNFCFTCGAEQPARPQPPATLITAEGLEGLGFTVCNDTCYLALPSGELEMFYLKSLKGWRVEFECGYIGVAPDLEWVASMIKLLRAANGEGNDD